MSSVCLYCSLSGKQHNARLLAPLKPAISLHLHSTHYYTQREKRKYTQKTDSLHRRPRSPLIHTAWPVFRKVPPRVFKIAGCASIHMAHVLRKRRRIAKGNDKTLKVAAWFLKSGSTTNNNPLMSRYPVSSASRRSNAPTRPLKLRRLELLHRNRGCAVSPAVPRRRPGRRSRAFSSNNPSDGNRGWGG